MKNLIENWKKTLIEIEELPPQNKSAIFDNVGKEAKIIINKVKTASDGDRNLAKEAMQSLIVALQDSLEEL